MSDLQGKNAIITGASRGLGAEITKKLWQEGANVFLVSRDEKTLHQLISCLEKRPNQFTAAFAADLADPASVPAIIAFAQNTFSQLDILINNAAIQGPIGVSWENDWEEWQRTITINLLAPINLSRQCSSWMIKNKSGKIISISGGGATGSRPNFSAYAVAKTGLVRFSEILAEELLPEHIQVNCIAPGAMSTSMLKEVVTAGPQFAGEKEFELAAKITSQPDQTIVRAAGLVSFLASSASDGITGKLISAVWDPWLEFPEHLDDLTHSDIYTLRRVVPKDRGMDWGDK